MFSEVKSKYFECYLGAGGKGDDRGWDGYVASPTRWTWVWVNSGRWWWTGRPGLLRFMGLQRVGHDWATELNWTDIQIIGNVIWPCLNIVLGEGNGTPLQYSCLENPRDGGAWWAAVYGVTQSRTRLKWLSSSSTTTRLIYLAKVVTVMIELTEVRSS